MHDEAWVPDARRIADANVTRLMRRAGVETMDALRRWSVADVDRYWDLAVRDLGIPFTTPYRAVRDGSRGTPWTTWFEGGEINVADACVDRWREDPEAAGAPALVSEAEDGAVQTLTFAELGDAVDRAANGLRRLGVGPGDAVAVFLPMIGEAVVAAYAIAKVGALYVPLFSGFAPKAIAARLRDAEAKVVVTTDWSWRRARHAPMKAALDD